MYCKNCGTEIPTGVSFCPNCRKDVSEKQENGINKLLLILLVVSVFTFIFIISLIINYEDDGYEPQKSPSQSMESTKQTEKDNWFYDGMYKVGTDIPEGEYFLVCNKGSAYYEVCSDSSGTFSSIVSNDNFDTFRFVTVIDGQYLSVSGAKFITAEMAIVPKADENGVYGEGMYRVGIDIPAGEYKVTCTAGSSCYIEVNCSSDGEFESIVSNDNIDTFAYIAVTDGQYLTVNRGEFSLVE